MPKELTDQIRQAAYSHFQQLGVPIRYVADSSLSKEDLARALARKEGISSGPMCLLACVEPCLSFQLRGDRQAKQLRLVLEPSKCTHLYHYFAHPQFGQLHVRVQTWFPFSVDVCLNGRQWLARQMDQAGIAYKQRDNCFVWIEDCAKAQRLLDQQLHSNWSALLDGLLELAHPLYRQVTSRMQGLHYYWSASQSEYATDILFDEPKNLQPLYRQFIHHAVKTFQSPDVMRFLGNRHAETQVSHQANYRYLEALASLTGTSPLREQATGVCQAVRYRRRRYRGLNPLAQADYQLLRAVSRGEFTLTGMRNADLRALLFKPTKSPQQRRRNSAVVTRQLTLLRAHGLLKKIPHTHRYQLTTKGRQIVTALLAACHADVEQLTQIAA